MQFGTLSQLNATNAVTGNYAGGLCGYNNTGIISECYSTGVVTGINGGGLVGQNSSGVIKDSFWDIETSGRTTSAGGTGLSSAEMKETFSSASMAGVERCGLLTLEMIIAIPDFGKCWAIFIAIS